MFEQTLKQACVCFIIYNIIAILIDMYTLKTTYQVPWWSGTTLQYKTID